MTAVCVDAIRHTISAGDRVVALERRPTLRALLYALAATPGREVDKETLVRMGWNASYRPLMHDNTLRVNIQNLRRLVSSFGLAIKFATVGYRLEAPTSIVLITPELATAR